MPTPYFGEEFTFYNPDGSTVRLRGWGNQYAAVFETLDGYTVVKDPATQFYQYARLSDDKTALVPTGTNVGSVDARTLALPRGIRTIRGSAKIQAKAAQLAGPQRRWEVRRQERRAALRQLNGPSAAPLAAARAAVTGDYKGLCILIQFPDVPATIARQEVDDFCNLSGYTGNGNNGSAYDYFASVSDGVLRYKNLVTSYYTAAHDRSYYADPSILFGERTRELILEALTSLRTGGFDFSSLTGDASGFIYALNVFYAGERVNNWSEGLWPHSWSLAAPFDATSTKKFSDYQITNMGSALTLRTFCHENGHMLCDFPDLYDYGRQGAGVGHFCLMCNGGSDLNPTQVSAYLKNLAGWTTRATALSPGSSASVRAGTNDFLFHRKTATEYFILENRQQSGRDASLPDAGLVIWHVDELGSNENEQMTAALHYELSLEQADGRFDLELRSNYGDASDLYGSPTAVKFGDTTVPSSKWWDGSASGLSIVDVSLPGPLMTVLTGGAVVYEHDDYGGRSQILDAGRYDLAALTIGNDVISSVRVPLGWRVTLYQHAGFSGTTRVLTADTPALPGFNDKVSSIVVEKNALVVVYEHDDYDGRSQVLDAGRYDLPALTIGNDLISSVRVPVGWRVTLYQHAGFSGTTRVLTADARALPGFNDTVSSIVIERDALAVVYEHDDYQGRSQILDGGRYDLAALSIGNDVISSLRVPAGWRVTLHQHAGFLGTTRVFTRGTRSLPDFNDQTSSIVVEKNALPVVYQHDDYGGKSQVLDVGHYDLPALTIGNDTVSSVRVPPGWRVTLHQHAGFSGTTRVLTADTPALPTFNDTASSVVVERRSASATKSKKDSGAHA